MWKIMAVPAIVMALLAVYLKIPGGKLWREFRRGVAAAMKELPFEQQTIITPELLADLPAPMQQYFARCGYMGKPLMRNARVLCTDVAFRMEPGKPAVPISYEIFLFAPRPHRLAFVNMGIHGIPFHGLDYYLGGEGHFTGVLAKQIRLFRSVSGSEAMGRGLLVAMLGEAVFLPSLYLEDYVTCTGVDERTVHLSAAYYGVQVEGTATFNEDYELVRFTTDSRVMDDGKGNTSPQRWTVETADYREENGIRYPHQVRVIWNLEEGDDVYFDSCSIALSYDETQLPRRPAKP